MKQQSIGEKREHITDILNAVQKHLQKETNLSKRDELFTKNQLDIAYGGYVPCVQCADRIVSNKLDISSLIENRICKKLN